MLIPISHYPTLPSIPPTLSPPVLSELALYKTALLKFFAQFDAVPVFFEVSRATARGGHAHVQVVPVPSKMADGVEDAFKRYGGDAVVWEQDPEETLANIYADGGGKDYFRVDLPGGGKMVHLLQGRGFNLQFGRYVFFGLYVVQVSLLTRSWICIDLEVHLQSTLA